MSIPNWFEFALLSLAAYRVFRLLSEDTVLDRPREYVVGLSGWQEGRPTPPGYRVRLAEFLLCSSCFGFWISVAWWLSYQLWEYGTVVAAVPFAISTVVIAVASLLNE
jgi:hypothetical protein